MTAGSPSSGASASASQALAADHRPASKGTLSGPGASSLSAASTSLQATGLSFNSSAAFQQVKQTQASLARLCRVHNHHQQQGVQHGPTTTNNNNQSSQQPANKLSLQEIGQQQQQQRPTTTTFVDCLIRRFKNCFSEDFCTVPMFVVGNLSPGSDGTHLILPPCVSLGRQSINRFSSPKNLRLLNSIRESCRSIEELDLGGNKLTDLIEVYKILQCTPNLRFLNLSENDLSRTSPVAMASLTTTTTASGGPGFSLTGTNYNGGFSSVSSASNVQLNQRACLAPINQNAQFHLGQHSAMSTRRHSTLGQATATSATTTTRTPATNSSRQLAPTTNTPACNRQTSSRVAEARRLAAANALAQSKKTSSMVASKLASSAATSGSLTRQPASGSLRTMSARDGLEAPGKQTRSSVAGQRHQGISASSMHLARSLSSLSAKDIRVAGSTSSRHRTGGSGSRRSSIGSSMRSSRSGEFASPEIVDQSPSASSDYQHQSDAAAASSQQSSSGITTSTSHQKLFVEPIVETDDVDMSAEQQASPSTMTTTATASSNTGGQTISSTATSGQQPTRTTTLHNNTGTTTLRSVCNNNTTATNFRRTFESIKALALNNTGCQWKVVCSILSRMPNLEELHLSLNNYERIDLEPQEFKHIALKRLYLCNNPKLTNWEELDKLLVAFPSLEALSIANCNISQIPDNLDRAREWRKLCGLNINGWPIKEWPVVERLNQLPSLVDLKCRNLDVLNSIDEPRHHLIARLPKLQRLNGSEIEEREHAEKAFLRFYMVNSHLERPSRFHELMQIYGEVSHVDVNVDLSPPSQAHVRVIYLNRNYYRKEDEDDVLMSEDFLLKLMDNVETNNVAVQDNGDETEGKAGGNNSLQENMEVAEASSSQASSSENSGPVRLFKDAGQEVVALDVDLRQSVRKFKSTIASLFGLESQNLILYYIDHEMVGLMGPELIKHNQKKLWNYNVQDGDQFIVEDR